MFVEVGTSKTQKPKGAGTKAFSDFFSSYLLLTVSLPEVTHILASMKHILQPEASQPRVIDTNLGSVEPTNTLIAQQLSMSKKGDFKFLSEIVEQTEKKFLSKIRSCGYEKNCFC